MKIRMGGGLAVKNDGTNNDQVAVDETGASPGTAEVFSLVPRIWPLPTVEMRMQRTDPLSIEDQQLDVAFKVAAAS